jgi:peptide/nickel transport system ATP-binding protein/oligopeptide transport system ATP-binding protein
MRRLRRQMQIIFQDPYSSLNPRLSVRTMLTEVLTVHGIARRRCGRERVGELLRMVGLSPSQAAAIRTSSREASASASASRARLRSGRG